MKIYVATAATPMGGIEPDDAEVVDIGYGNCEDEALNNLDPDAREKCRVEMWSVEFNVSIGESALGATNIDPRFEKNAEEIKKMEEGDE